MIVYGYRSSKLSTETFFNEPCPSCGQKTTVEMYVFGKYAHIFFIPLFPLGKNAVSQCEHCKAVLKEKQMNAELKERAVSLKSTSKVPVWHFTGLALIAILIGFGILSAQRKEKENKKYAASPQKGDTYYFKTDDRHYSAERVVAVTADSISLELNDMETNKKSGMKEIDRPQNYSGFGETRSRKEIEKQVEDGTIYEIKR